MMTTLPLEDCRILVVEDEYLLADEIQAELASAGATVVGPVGGLAKALAIIEATEVIHGAVLDVNLRGEVAFPAAEVLQDRNIPTLFVSGYEATVLPSRFKNAPHYEKPVAIRQIVETLANALRQG